MCCIIFWAAVGFAENASFQKTQRLRQSHTIRGAGQAPGKKVKLTSQPEDPVMGARAALKLLLDAADRAGKRIDDDTVREIVEFVRQLFGNQADLNLAGASPARQLKAIFVWAAAQEGIGYGPEGAVCMIVNDVLRRKGISLDVDHLATTMNPKFEFIEFGGGYLPRSAVQDEQAKPGESSLEVFRVYYCTNRAPVSLLIPFSGYSDRRSDTVSYGLCEVVIPKSHKIGSIGSN
jgi:hypothetical protein